MDGTVGGQRDVGHGPLSQGCFQQWEIGMNLKVHGKVPW